MSYREMSCKRISTSGLIHQLLRSVEKGLLQEVSRGRSTRKLGISHRDAYVIVNSRRGYYHVSATRVLQTAISKERLNKRGLVNCLDHYLKVHINTN